MRTLLVDDSSTVLRCLKSYVSKHSECDQARDGLEGLDTFRRSLEENRQYDLICLDLEMPKMDGWTLLKRIRAQEQALQLASRSKILVITSVADTAAVLRIKKEGADGYLLKPVSCDRFQEQLVRLGLISGFTGTKAEKLAEDLTCLADADEIPTVVLARLIQKMAGSLERQASRDSAASVRVGPRPAVEAEVAVPLPVQSDDSGQSMAFSAPS